MARGVEGVGGGGFDLTGWSGDWTAGVQTAQEGKKKRKKKGELRRIQSLLAAPVLPLPPQSLWAAGSQPALPDCLPPSHAAYLTPPCAHRLAATTKKQRHY